MATAKDLPLDSPDRDLTPPPAAARPRIRIGRTIREAWAHRGVVRALAERTIRSRYKQATLSFAWTVLTPVGLMLVFAVFINRAAQFETNGVPYPVFSYLGLTAWTFFSRSVGQGAISLVGPNLQLINKVYVPREVFPAASLLTAAFDTAAALVPLAILFAIYGTGPALGALYWFPLLVLVQVAFTLAVTLLIAVGLVYIRDIGHTVPLILQLGMLATPVVYGLETLESLMGPVGIKFYTVINPLVPIIDGYRRVVFDGTSPDVALLAIGALSSCGLLVGALYIFKLLERGIADVA